jgi:hypothetical protein
MWRRDSYQSGQFVGRLGFLRATATSLACFGVDGMGVETQQNGVERARQVLIA